MENNHRTYELLTLHCSPATVTAMKSMKDYTKCRDNQDGIGLLALIQAVSFNKNAAEGTHGLLSVVNGSLLRNFVKSIRSIWNLSRK